MAHPFMRTIQFVTCHALPLMPWPAPVLLTGNGSLLKIPEELTKNKTKNVLLVTTEGTLKRGTLDALLEEMNRCGIAVTKFTEVPPNPTILSIEAGRKAYLEGRCNAIVAVGGGSVMDCAKVIGARIVKPNKTVSQMKGLFKVMKKLPDLYLAPTTAGTGSEVTVAAVVTDSETHYKYAVSDTSLIPKYAVLDPSLTRSLSPYMTATTGMDALTHAVEAYTNLYSQKSSDESAVKAVKMIFENLQKAFEDGSDMAARVAMLEASFEAGKAFTKSYVGYVHAIAHAVGGLYGTAHGLANAVILPVVMEAFGTGAAPALAELAKAVGLRGQNDEELAKAFIGQIRRMNDVMGLPFYLAELQEKDIPELARRAVKEGNPGYPVPVIWTQKEMEQVIRRLLPPQ